MKLLRLFSAVLLFTFYCLLFTLPVHAIDPFPPFSTEGNPDEDVYYESFFPLFRYIKPAQLKVYENRDRSRNYQDFIVCAGKQYDSRDYKCDNVDDGCDGGDVGICRGNDPGGSPDHYAHSGNGSCSASKKDPPGTTGKCTYRQTPKISGELKATDFSAIDRSSSTFFSSITVPTPTPIATPASSGAPAAGTGGTIVYHKLQGENERFDYFGNDNAVTWGSHRLQLTQDDQLINQLMVLYRARQTKETLRVTGEWPLGWVDWGYETTNGKTLIDIADEVPSEITGSIKIITEGVDDFFLNAGNLEAVSDVTGDRQAVIKNLNKIRTQNPPPEWLTDVLQSPVYPPSFRQGYARGSICVWNKCCPGYRCPFPEVLFGNSRGLYGDISISQTFGASLDDLLMNYSLEEGAKTFKKLAQANPLIRFAGSASQKAVPSEIHRRLTEEIKNKCMEYVPEPGKFSLKWFGFYMDYADPPTYLDDAKKCPGWAIQPELEQQKGGAFPQSILAKLISLIWGGGTVDDVDPVKYHLITIPDAMGQFISEIQEPVYETRDTIADNEASKEHYDSITNIIDSTNEYLTGGKGLPVADDQRRLAYFTCSDPDYSNPFETSIEAYALGTRIGCFSSTEGESAVANCDTTVPEQNLPGLNVAAGKDYTDRLFAGCTGNSQWMQCHNDVIKRASASGVDPLFALAIWIHESGASNYQCGRQFTGGIAVQDFGINLTEIAENFTAQIAKFLALPTSYDYCGKSMSNFIAKFWFGKCYADTSGEEKNRISAYIGEINTIYNIIAPGKQVPAWPQTGPYVPSDPNPTNPQSSGAPASSGAPTKSPGPNGQQKVNPAGSCGDGYIDTGLGCVPYSRDAFISAVLSLLAGVSGLIALVTMMVAVFQIMTAGGNPQQLEKGKELFAAAIAGLLFVVFSVTLLRIIAGDIIKLPGF